MCALPLEDRHDCIVGPFTPDGNHLIVRIGRRKLQFWNLASEELALELPGIWFSLTLSPDGTLLAAANYGANLHTVALNRHPLTARDLGSLTHRLVPKAISPDNLSIATKREFTDLNELVSIDARTGIPVRDLPVPRAGKTQRAVFTADGACFCAAFIGGNIHRYSLREEVQSRVFAGHSDNVTWLALLADDRILVTQSEDETTRFWDTATGGQLAVLPWSGGYHGATITSGNRFVLRKGDRTVVGELIRSDVCSTVALSDPDPGLGGTRRQSQADTSRRTFRAPALCRDLQRRSLHLQQTNPRGTQDTDAKRD